MTEDDTKDPGTPDDLVAEAKKRFERAKTAYSENRQQAIEDLRFVFGDSDNLWQWPAEIVEQRKGKVILTVNLTAQHCNQIINSIRQNRPTGRVIPTSGGANKKAAEVFAGLVRMIQTASNADDAHDTAAEFSIYGGEGYWRIVTEYESPTSFKQRIRIKPCLNPQLVYIDPDCQEIDESDASWGFIFEDISREQAKREHPGIDLTSWTPDPGGWVSKDTVRRAEYFYCEWQDDSLYLLADGSTVLKSKAVGPVDVRDERPTKVKRWKWCKLVGGSDSPVDEKDWPGSFLPIISVVGKKVNIDGKILIKGQTRDLKDPARMVNYAYSETVQTLAVQNKVPYLAAAESIAGYESTWKTANQSDYAYLPWNAYHKETGQQLPAPAKEAPAQMATAQVALLQLSTEQMRAASGQQNANFGIKSEAVSGIGIQRLKTQGEVATFHFPDNLARALKHEIRILVDLIPKIMDVRQSIIVLGLDGKESTITLDPEHRQAYSEEDFGTEDVQKIFNPNLGEYQYAIDTGPSYSTQRQEALDYMMTLAAKDPQVLQIAGDLVMRLSDSPMSEQLAERFAKALPPPLQDQKPGDPQQLMMQLQQMQQQMQQGMQAYQQLQQEYQALQNELKSKAFVEQIRQQGENAREEARKQIEVLTAHLGDQAASQQRDFEAWKARLEAETQVVIADIRAQSAVDVALQSSIQSDLGSDLSGGIGMTG